MDARVTVSRAVGKQCKYWMQDVCTSEAEPGVPLLLRVVGDGPYKHRVALIKAFKDCGLPMDENVANSIYDFFVKRVSKVYGNGVDDGRDVAKRELDKLHVSSALTDKEFQRLVDTSWEWEDGSSESARRQFKHSEEANRMFAPRNAIDVNSGVTTKG